MAAYDITTANSWLEFDTASSKYPSCYKIDDNHFINFWQGVSSYGITQIFTVDTATWAVTTANAKLDFDTSTGCFSNSCCQIDSNHFINFWADSSVDGFVQVFTVNTSTWAVTTANASLEFDAVNGSGNSCCQIDSNHFINFWTGNGSDGFTQVFTVNTTTWAVTTANSALEFDTVVAQDNSSFKVDINHFINFWTGDGDDGFVQVFTVNTSTWEITTAADRLEFDVTSGQLISCHEIDDNHFIAFWIGSGDDGFTQVFTVNTSTWVVTTAAATLEFDTEYGSNNNCYKIDSNHFINFWTGSGFADGFTQVFTVNTSTWEITTAADRLEFDTQNKYQSSCYPIDSNHFINFWAGGSSSHAYVQVFNIESAAPTGPANLKTYNTNLKANIKTINTNAIANVKSLNTNT